MDFPSLKAFISVAECRSFSLAAERLFMTQPAISKRVASLEEDLGVALFDRLGRNIELTEAGEKFLVSARRILDDIIVSREEVHSPVHVSRWQAPTCNKSPCRYPSTATGA